jgi:translation initiation factor 1
MGKEEPRDDRAGAPHPSSNPFRAWRDAQTAAREAGVPAEHSHSPAPAPPEPPHARDRGSVDVIRHTAGRGGKAVTVITNFSSTSEAELRELARLLRKACGTGGTAKEGRIEIQGEKRDEVKRILEEAGYRPVFAGG